MNRRDLIAIFLLTLGLRVVVAALQSHPGYMDAYYYAVGAQRLADGDGFTEPILWNYLDDPGPLPHPSHLYWMPLPSIAAGLSMAAFGPTYRAAQLPFVLLAAALPPIAYLIAWRVTARRRAAWLAALLMIFSGFFVPYWGVPESFAPYALFGSLALLLVGVDRSRPALLAAGACAGLAHLSRADGALLLVAMLAAAVMWPKGSSAPGMRDRLVHSAMLLVGYAVVMLPWFARNLAAVGTPLPAAGTQALWLCDYDELFSYGARLDLRHWLECGIGSIVATKLRGLAIGGVHVIAENALVFLAPLMAVGLWRVRREPTYRPAILYLVLLFAAMTLAFTFVGERGGWFHSSAALMPFLCAAVPVGLDAIIEAVARRRRTWDANTAGRVFGIGAVALAACFSAAIVWSRVIASDWNGVDTAYREVGAWLAGQGDEDSVVMAGNPPGFTYHTGHPSIVVPHGDVGALLQAANRYGARWLVLDANRPAPLAGLYADPQSDPRLSLAASFGPTLLFEIARP